MARAYFFVAGILGRMLRSARYTQPPVVQRNGRPRVLKRRSFYAPLLIWLSGPVVRLLDTGVRVLGHREWVERERVIHGALQRGPVHVEADGTVVLPYLAGRTLAALLEDLKLEEPFRRKAIERAAASLAEFHQLGFTHADAMAENVLVDLEAGVAHWFDFETIHEPSRSVTWRRADDLRALVGTCLLRSDSGKSAETLKLILDAYADQSITRYLAMSFSSVWRRSLAFHLAQAGLSFERFCEIGRLMRAPMGAAQLKPRPTEGAQC